MSAIVQRRARIARVRRVQHLQVAVQAANAEERATSLENTAEHLSRLCLALAPDPGALSGAQLGNAAELAGRLDTMRFGLTDTIVAARATADEQAGRRVQARIVQESAERLEERAARDADTVRERRLAAVHRPRPAARA